MGIGTQRSKEEGKQDGQDNVGQKTAANRGSYKDVKEKVRFTKPNALLNCDLQLPLAMEKDEAEKSSEKPHNTKQILNIQAKAAELFSALGRIPALGFEPPLSIGKVKIRWTCVSDLVMHNFYPFLAHSRPYAN